jgi:hypothetical protein
MKAPHSWVVLNFVLSLGIGGTACTTQPRHPPPRTAAPPQVHSDNRRPETSRRPRPLLAPPPAYGNKVVRQGSPAPDAPASAASLLLDANIEAAPGGTAAVVPHHGPNVGLALGFRSNELALCVVDEADGWVVH